MRHQLARVFRADLAVFESNRAWIRAIIKSHLDPFAAESIVGVLVGFIDYQLDHKNAMRAIESLEPQDRPRRRIVRRILNLLKYGFCEFDYSSKKFCRRCVQS